MADSANSNIASHTGLYFSLSSLENLHMVLWSASIGTAFSFGKFILAESLSTT